MDRARVIPLQRDRQAQQLSSAVQARKPEQPGDDAGQALSASGSQDIDIAAGGTVEVYHRLGRLPRGWRLLDLTASAAITTPVRRTAWTADSLTLANDATVAVTVRVEVL